MSDVGTTDARGLAPVVRDAAAGVLPPWAEAGPGRRAHIARVAELVRTWAEALRLPAHDRDRWVAAAWLHDALRDADPERLREGVLPELRDLPPPLLHGPAAAERIGDVADPELRDAVRYHTVGHPSLGPLGRALYLADFLEPGRPFLVEWRATLASRMPQEMDAVLVDVLDARIRHLLEERKAIRPETAGFWSAAVAGAA